MIWMQKFDKTQRLFKHVPDKALGQSGDPQGRTLGGIAWHITQTIPEMMNHTGLNVEGPGEKVAVPQSMAEIRKAYEKSALSLLEQVKSRWTDDSLEASDALYGQMWKRGYTLAALILHQTHHRGQMTVLMRQAGLPVPGLYGPAREEWAQWGLPVPPI